MLKFLPWQVVVLVIAVLISGSFSCFITAKYYQAEMAQIRQAHSAAIETATDAHNQALLAELTKLQLAHTENQRITGELLTIQQQLSTTQQQLRRSIHHATKTDGNNFSGLGANGLQLYCRALGYAASDCQLSARSGSTPANADKTGTTATGLSPEDIIAHAADYGEYCQQLERQLGAIIEWENQQLKTEVIK